MDHLTFLIEERPGNLNDHIALPMVNGRSLIDYVKEIEAEYNSGLAGLYDGIRPDRLLKGLKNAAPGGESYILECDCGVPGCWPVVMYIMQTENSYIWKNFRHDHRDEWDYSNMPIFEFDREQYEKALDTLEQYKP